tara:strand:+ start:2302 stop:2559 length:258 start_codon:yes stop_codon:yes gene_type:complete
MSKISSYSDAGTPTFNDKVIGTEIAATPANATKNFTLAQLVVLFNGGATPTGATPAAGKGEIRVDNTNLYIYTGSAWKKVALSAL